MREIQRNGTAARRMIEVVGFLEANDIPRRKDMKEGAHRESIILWGKS